MTWFPVLHDLFTRMWFVLALGMTAALGMLARWRELSAGERLLLLWVGLGSAELILHDVGNERRFIFFIPAFVALAAIALGRARILPEGVEHIPRKHALDRVADRALRGATSSSAPSFAWRFCAKSARTSGWRPCLRSC